MDVTDITESIKNTNRYNFHSHTEFCDGHAPMATMAEAAAGDGFEIWVHPAFPHLSRLPVQHEVRRYRDIS